MSADNLHPSGIEKKVPLKSLKRKKFSVILENHLDYFLKMQSLCELCLLNTIKGIVADVLSSSLVCKSAGFRERLRKLLITAGMCDLNVFFNDFFFILDTH